MKILILGNKGYIGRALTPYLQQRGHTVFGMDNNLREENVRRIGGSSLIPLPLCDYTFLDITNYAALKNFIAQSEPEAIVDLAEQPSAPFSMIDNEHCVETQRNNVVGTLNLLWAVKEVNPNIHIVKLGSMGVYGTPEQAITETDGAIAYDPASFYHISKAADSINCRKVSQWWGLNITDIHQGVVYGHVEGTRFDYDSFFGTVINRFLVQALAGIPLTVYGKGKQIRSFIHILDSLQCLTLALENPAQGYRVLNQFSEYFSIDQIARSIALISEAKIAYIANPRYEKEEHIYTPSNQRLLNLGFKPHDFAEELVHSWQAIQAYKKNINIKVIPPVTTWTTKK